MIKAEDPLTADDITKDHYITIQGRTITKDNWFLAWTHWTRQSKDVLVGVNELLEVGLANKYCAIYFDPPIRASIILTYLGVKLLKEWEESQPKENDGSTKET